MRIRFYGMTGVMALLFSGVVSGQVPPPPPASPTLWSFLGIPQGLYKLNAQIFNRRGNFPGLEKKPPLKAIADVANLKSEVPAIKAAAEIKQAEDLAPQKIKAIKYLATIGCGCYDKDEKVTKAILAATEDCTEDVRLAAVEAVAVAASGEACEHCKQRSCCNEKLVAQLSKMAYERDDKGCFIEPSERIREKAKEALRVCCPGRGPLPQEAAAPEPVEGVDQPKPVEGANPAAESGLDTAPPPPVVDPTTLTPPAPVEDSPRLETRPAKRTASRPLPMKSQAQLLPAPVEATPRAARQPLKLTASQRVVSADSAREREQDLAPRPPLPEDVVNDVKHASPLASDEQNRVRVYKRVAGRIAQVAPQGDSVHLHLHGQTSLPVGATVKVLHAANSGAQVATLLEVTESQIGWANARVTRGSRAIKLVRGDEIEAWQ